MSSDSRTSTELIGALESGNASAGKEAARELYRRGREAAGSAIELWRKDAQIAALISTRATVGIAVSRDNFAAIRAAIGNPALAEVPPDQDAEEFEWRVAADVHLDILTSRQPDGEGAIARFLRKSGEAIQQVEFETSDVDAATEAIRTRLGISAIYPATRQGADGTRVNFFLLDAPDGKKILIELVEAAGKK